jgi:hypothetical protein
MKQLLIRQGCAGEVPVPQLEPGTVLVRVQYSCISSGTEIRGIKRRRMLLWKRALARLVDLVRLFKMATSEGVAQHVPLRGKQAVRSNSDWLFGG